MNWQKLLNRKNLALLVILAGGISTSLLFSNCNNAKYELNEQAEDPIDDLGNPDPPPPVPVGFWRFGNYDATCSRTCGGGTRTREVWCEDATGARADELLCAGTERPASSQACNLEPCNATFYYVPGEWSPCTGNTQTRTLTCYNGATSTPASPLDCASLTAPITSRSCASLRSVTQIYSLLGPSNQLDVLLVIDDSSSMQPEQARLAQRMSSFITSLTTSNLDWQMCYTTTDFNYYKGSPLRWQGLTSEIVNRTTPNAATVIANSITAVGAGFGNDEQAIRSTHAMMGARGQHACFRNQSALSVIVLSDEDERSVGGDRALSANQYRELASENMPINLIMQVRNIFGNNKRFRWHSIITIPGDSTCLTTQNAQASPSFPGILYSQLSNITGGEITSICQGNYSRNLNQFLSSMVQQTTQVELDCSPHNGAVEVTTIPLVNNLNTTVTGSRLSFNPALPINTQVRLSYQCPR